LRATDHLRNLGATGNLIVLRDRLQAGQRWIAYRLRYSDGRPQTDFTSYSAEYWAGDRLVTSNGDELHVIEADLTTAPWELRVGAWRKGAHRPSGEAPEQR